DKNEVDKNEVDKNEVDKNEVDKNEVDKNEVDKRDDHVNIKDSEYLKNKIKEELYKKLSIALDVNMHFNTYNKYYMKFYYKKKYNKYIMSLSHFIIILGKHLQLSDCTIFVALYYMHKYNQKSLSIKKNSTMYLLAGACILLAWEIREDVECMKKRNKLFDIPVAIFKLVNYFDKKKKIKKKVKSVEMMIYHDVCKGSEKINDGEKRNIEKKRGSGKRDSKKKVSGKKDNKRQSHITDDEKKNKQFSKNLSLDDNTILTNIYEKDLTEIKEIINNENITDINNIHNVSNYFDSYMSECNSTDISEYELSQQCTINEKKNVINFNNSEKKIQTFLLKETTTHLNNFITLCKQKQKDITISFSKWIINDNSHKFDIMQKVIIFYQREILKSFSYYIKPEIVTIETSESYIQKFIYIINDKHQGGSDSNGSDSNGSDGVGSDGVGRDGVGRDGVGRDGVGRDGVGRDGVGRDGVGRDGVGRDGVGRDGVGRDGVGRDGVGSDVGDGNDNYCYMNPKDINFLSKITILNILDIYKTPLCLIFTTKEILVTCILRAFFFLCFILGTLDLDVLSFDDFENKIKLFIKSVSTDEPI
ncbi:conserved protein, unknown function, partial [Hepatocystis sp. ex Piliocolobus tephrosceles]